MPIISTLEPKSREKHRRPSEQNALVATNGIQIPSLVILCDNAFVSIVRMYTGVDGANSKAPPGKKPAFLGHFYIQTITLPRQARDKHRENSNRQRCFLTGAANDRRLYSRWSQHEPNNAGQDEDCVVWSPRGWKDVACSTTVTCFLCEHYPPREAKWGQIPSGSATASGGGLQLLHGSGLGELYCNLEQLLDLAASSISQTVDFDDTQEDEEEEEAEQAGGNSPPTVAAAMQLLENALEAASVLWSTRNVEGAVAGLIEALSKFGEIQMGATENAFFGTILMLKTIV
jgi:hypothetical protein